jgi:YD repeat-containing protein
VSTSEAKIHIIGIGSGNALVAPVAGGGWAVRFAGTLGGSVQPSLTGNGSGLIGTSPSVVVTVTSLGGDAGRVQQTTDPRGIVSKTDSDYLGRTLRTISAFSAFAPSSSGDNTVEYSYDGSNHVVLTLADLASGSFQQTKNVYGVTTASGSGVNSNDLLGQVQYPDPSTGWPSDTLKETYTVNALGQQLTMTDRNGTVHTYTLDVLGRVTSDVVTTLGNRVASSSAKLHDALSVKTLRGAVGSHLERMGHAGRLSL